MNIKDLITRFSGGKSPSLDEAKRLGEKSRLLWENKDFQRAVDKVRFGILEKWAGSPITDREGQHELRLLLKCLDDIEGNIKKEMADGAFAEKLIKDEQAKQERAKNVTIFRR